MNARTWMLLILCTAVSQFTLASPVLLLCVTKTVTRNGISDFAHDGQSYQITFDEAESTVAVDGNIPVKASITPTLIDWGNESTGGAWHIDRLTGAWHHWQFSESNQLAGIHLPEKVSGTCVAPPKRKF
jgi:hypothetical protein